MKELGFNPNGSEAVKEAFIKHLIKASTGIQVQTPTEKRIVAENPETIFPLNKNENFSLPAQLAFDFGDSEESIGRTKKKKAI